MHDLTHASFFSGVGGLDLGLERAGWRTVSFSEIDPYASAALAERWPGVPNLGDIVRVDERDRRESSVGHGGDASEVPASRDSEAWHTATLWTGGFPCQDLSVAGKRRGMGTAEERTRSGLAYAFLDLVEQHRPPAILLENVPGLLSSHRGRDMAALLGRLAELGYWWAYRILDAQFFGVPQRRRRVFICALHAGAGFGSDSAAAVLSVGARCDGHSAAGDEARTGASSLTGGGADSPQSERVWGVNGPGPNLDTGRAVPTIFNATAKFGQFAEDDIAGNLSARDYKSSSHLVSPSPDPGGVREADGLAGRLDDRPELAATLNEGLRKHSGQDDDGRFLVAYRKATRAHHGDDWERWQADDTADTIDANGHTARTATAVMAGPDMGGADPLLPLGLDSHRYRCCGNGVVSDVSEWVGVRLARAMA